MVGEAGLCCSLLEEHRKEIAGREGHHRGVDRAVEHRRGCAEVHRKEIVGQEVHRRAMELRKETVGLEEHRRAIEQEADHRREIGRAADHRKGTVLEEERRKETVPEGERRRVIEREEGRKAAGQVAERLPAKHHRRSKSRIHLLCRSAGCYPWAYSCRRRQ